MTKPFWNEYSPAVKVVIYKKVQYDYDQAFTSYGAKLSAPTPAGGVGADVS